MALRRYSDDNKRTGREANKKKGKRKTVKSKE